MFLSVRLESVLLYFDCLYVEILKCPLGCQQQLREGIGQPAMSVVSTPRAGGDSWKTEVAQKLASLERCFGIRRSFNKPK